MLADAENAVEKFQLKYRIPTGLVLETLYDSRSRYRTGAAVRTLRSIIQELWTQSDQCSPNDKVIIGRICVMAEEFAELLDCMAQGDELGTLDGLTDTIYTLVGTAVTFSMPLSAAFQEVQRSNMTKTLKEGNSKEVMKLEKGLDYSPPDLLRVVNDWTGHDMDCIGLLTCKECSGRLNDECE